MPPVKPARFLYVFYRVNPKPLLCFFESGYRKAEDLLTAPSLDIRCAQSVMKAIEGYKRQENYVLCSKMRTVHFPQPSITVRQQGRQVTLCSDKPVFSVFIEPENDVNADDNCLFLQPGKEYTVTFEDDPGQVTVFSFADLRMNS